jgi:hypothetical protein
MVLTRPCTSAFLRPCIHGSQVAPSGHLFCLRLLHSVSALTSGRGPSRGGWRIKNCRWVGSMAAGSALMWRSWPGGVGQVLIVESKVRLASDSRRSEGCGTYPTQTTVSQQLFNPQSQKRGDKVTEAMPRANVVPLTLLLCVSVQRSAKAHVAPPVTQAEKAKLASSRCFACGF